MINGVFEVEEGAISYHINQPEIHRNIVYNDACGFVEIII